MPRVHLVIVLLLLPGLLCGCPDQGQQKVGVKLPAQPDKYDQLAEVLADQDAFLAELARLQALHTSPPEEAAATPGDADLRYSLKADVSSTRAVIQLLPRSGGSAAGLVCWEEGQGQSALKVVRQAEEAGGLRLELNSADELSITVLARWVNGRYLQVSREVVLQGLDHTAVLHTGGTSWKLECDWLPYRVVPGREGPYGVVGDAEADGRWHSQVYPDRVMVPAVGAFNKTGGWWLASLDRAAKDLSRNHDLGWRIDPEYKDGAAILLGYRYYDGVEDRYAQQALTSGLPIRDAVALEPVTLMEVSADHTQVAAETREMIQHLGALSRTFWFQPKPPEPLQPGSIVSLQQWVSHEEQLEDRLRTATGLWEARLNIADIPDAKLGPTGYGGIGAVDIGGGGLPEPARATLEKLEAGDLPTVQLSLLDQMSPANSEAKPSPYWRPLKPWGLGAGHTEDAHGFVRLNVRQPQCSAWILRKQMSDLEANPLVVGYQVPIRGSVPDKLTDGGPWLVSIPQAQAWLHLSFTEEISAARRDYILAFRGLPNLAVPPCGQVYQVGETGEAGPIPNYQEGHATQVRHVNDVLIEVFGIAPWVEASTESLALQALATTGNVHGHVLSRKLSAFAGFDAFAENQTALRKSGGDVKVLYSDPAESKYGTFGERPAEVTKLIGVLPNNLKGSRAVWVCFYGAGGSVVLNTDNELTVTWEGGSWRERLPGGMWRIEHPSPDHIQPGDVVLVKFSPMKVQPRGEAAQG